MVEDKYLLEELTWTEAKDKFKETDIALLPVGSLEQHGPHLPLSTDAFDAYWLAKEAVKRVASPKPVILPPINYGISYHHMAFAGTISLSPETLISLIYDIGCSLVTYEVKKLLIINGHGGNSPALKCAAQKLGFEKKIFVVIDDGKISASEQKEICSTQNDAHSGEYETSTSLANRPELVKLNGLVKEVPKFPSPYLAWDSANQVSWVFTTDKLSKSGVLGDATLASKDKGDKLWEAHIKNLAEFIEYLKVCTL
ncbi:MAG: creatininase family protein [Candidatus Stahlbacteria bacterium]|nr:creatininase family protein [Candidatus Stahlbacteria bacterium]